MKKDSEIKTFAQWANHQLPSQKKMIQALRRLVREVAPTLSESVKWTNGVWLGEEYPVAFLHAKDDHLQFGFFGGSSLKDPKRLLQGSGKHVKHIKIYQLSEIQETAFARLIRQATKAERE
jgi:hypothetical protein